MSVLYGFLHLSSYFGDRDQVSKSNLIWLYILLYDFKVVKRELKRCLKTETLPIAISITSYNHKPTCAIISILSVGWRIILKVFSDLLGRIGLDLV